MPYHAKSLQTCLTLCSPTDCVAHQTPLSMEFSRQEYWSGLPVRLLQGTILTRGLSPRLPQLPHCRLMLY